MGSGRRGRRRRISQSRRTDPRVGERLLIPTTTGDKRITLDEAAAQQVQYIVEVVEVTNSTAQLRFSGALMESTVPEPWRPTEEVFSVDFARIKADYWVVRMDAGLNWFTNAVSEAERMERSRQEEQQDRQGPRRPRHRSSRKASTDRRSRAADKVSTRSP